MFKKKNSSWSLTLTIFMTAIVVGVFAYMWQKSEVQVVTRIEQGYSRQSPFWDIFAEDIQKDTGEILNSLYMPEDSENSDMIYFSTSSQSTGQWPNISQTNKIYSYDLKTGKQTQLYEEKADRTLRTMGVKGKKLIIMNDMIDNSPGPCFAVWASWEDFSYLNTSSPDGLNPYTVPEAKVQKAWEEQKECVEESIFFN